MPGLDPLPPPLVDYYSTVQSSGPNHRRKAPWSPIHPCATVCPSYLAGVHRQGTPICAQSWGRRGANQTKGPSWPDPGPEPGADKITSNLIHDPTVQSARTPNTKLINRHHGHQSTGPPHRMRTGNRSTQTWPTAISVHQQAGMAGWPAGPMWSGSSV